MVLTANLRFGLKKHFPFSGSMYIKKRKLNSEEPGQTIAEPRGRVMDGGNLKRDF